jgi:hypothetical protein
MEAFKLSGSVELKDAEKTQQQVAGVSKEVDKTQENFDKAGTKATAFGGSLAGMAAKAFAAAAVIDTMKVALNASIDAAIEGQKVQAATEAVIKSTGMAAGYTADQIARLAQAESYLTGIDDETVQSGENMLLTFRNIGKDVFPEAVRAMEDMAAAMAGGDIAAIDLKGTAIQLGKALNDPLQGLTALSRVGVTFTESQKAEIETMVALGDVAGAQRVILKELQIEFGGMAEQLGNTDAGKLQKAQNAIGNLGQAIGDQFLPWLGQAANAVTELLTRVERLDNKLVTHGEDVITTANSYADYTTALQEEAKAAGYTIDAEGNLIRTYVVGQSVRQEVVKEHYLLSEGNYNAQKAIQAHGNALDGWDEKAKKAIDWEAALKTAQEDAKDARAQAVASIQEYARALDEAQASARALTIEESGLAESLKGATNAQLGKESIRELNKALQDGKITGSDYKKMVEDVQLSFGLATPASLALAGNISAVTQAAEAGVIPADKLSEAIAALKTDAADGKVDLSKILTTNGADPAKLAPFLKTLEDTAAKNKELSDTTGNMSDNALALTSSLAGLDEKYLSNSENAALATQAAEQYRLKVLELKALVDSLQNKTLTITWHTVYTSGSVPGTPNSTGSKANSDSGNASGADFDVPLGYPHDTYGLRVQSGEHVTVTPASERSRPGRGGGMTVWGDVNIILNGADELGAEQIMAKVQTR